MCLSFILFFSFRVKVSTLICIHIFLENLYEVLIFEHCLEVKSSFTCSKSICGHCFVSLCLSPLFHLIVVKRLKGKEAVVCDSQKDSNLRYFNYRLFPDFWSQSYYGVNLMKLQDNLWALLW